MQRHIEIREDMNSWFNNPLFDFDINKDFPIESYNTLIWFLMSGRNRGKSFNVTSICLYDAWVNNRDMYYCRRDVESCKPKKVQRYFTEHTEFIRDLTQGKADRVIASEDTLYFAGLDKQGRVVKVKECGAYGSLYNEELIKSLKFPKIYNILLEEVFTNKRYLHDEANHLMSLISTIRRNKTLFNVFCITNTVSRLNPYVEYFAIEDMRTIKAGERVQNILHTAFRDENDIPIDYHICVDYLENKWEEGQKSGRVIGTNNWEEKDSYTIYDYNLIKDNREILTRVVFETMGFYYLATLIKINTQAIGIDNNDTDKLYLYIERKTSILKPNTRVYSKRKVPFQNYCSRLAQNNFDKLIFMLVKTNKLLYSDNLTANEFQQCISDIGII